VYYIADISRNQDEVPIAEIEKLVDPINLIQALDPKGCEEFKISDFPVIGERSINYARNVRQCFLML
jgi:hypothetical protein